MFSFPNVNELTQVQKGWLKNFVIKAVNQVDLNSLIEYEKYKYKCSIIQKIASKPPINEFTDEEALILYEGFASLKDKKVIRDIESGLPELIAMVEALVIYINNNNLINS